MKKNRFIIKISYLCFTIKTLKIDNLAEAQTAFADELYNLYELSMMEGHHFVVRLKDTVRKETLDRAIVKPMTRKNIR